MASLSGCTIPISSRVGVRRKPVASRVLTGVSAVVVGAATVGAFSHVSLFSASIPEDDNDSEDLSSTDGTTLQAFGLKSGWSRFTDFFRRKKRVHAKATEVPPPAEEGASSPNNLRASVSSIDTPSRPHSTAGSPTPAVVPSSSTAPNLDWKVSKRCRMTVEMPNNDQPREEKQQNCWDKFWGKLPPPLEDATKVAQKYPYKGRFTRCLAKDAKQANPNAVGFWEKRVVDCGEDFTSSLVDPSDTARVYVDAILDLLGEGWSLASQTFKPKNDKLGFILEVKIDKNVPTVNGFIRLTYTFDENGKNKTKFRGTKTPEYDQFSARRLVEPRLTAERLGFW